MMRTPDPDDILTEVTVHAAVLTATADLLDLLADFFTETDPAIRTQLGSYLIDRYGQENTADSVTEAIVMLAELSEAAELLHALAGQDNADTDTDTDIGIDRQQRRQRRRP